MGFLPAVVGIKDASGARLDQQAGDGTRAPIILKYGDGFTHTVTANGGTQEVSSSIDPAFIAAAAEGAGAAVADIAHLRAIPAADRQDGQSRTVLVDVNGVAFTAIFKTAGGAGIADDGTDVFLPDDKVIGDPDRWYRDPPSGTPTRQGLITVADMARLRGGLGGTLRARAAALENRSLASSTRVFDDVSISSGQRVFLNFQSSGFENGLYIATDIGGEMVSLARAPEFDDPIDVVYGSTISIAEGTLYSGSIWQFMTAGAIVVGATGLAFSRRGDVEDRLRLETLFQFEGVPVMPGSNKAVEIQAILDAGSTAVLQPGGVYQIEAPITVNETHKGLGIVCMTGVATIQVTFTPDVSQADVSTNAMILVRGSLDTAKLNTTLTTAITPGGVAWYAAGARKVSLASVGTLVADDWFVTNGHETGNGEIPGGSNGVNIESQEMMRVASTSALKVTLAWPTQQHHVTTNGGVGTALSVKGVRPCEAFRIEGIDFDARGGTIAVGILMEYCHAPVVKRCKFSGFSRTAIEGSLGTRRLYLSDILIDGECNSGLILSSALNTQITDYRTTSSGLRHHANGTFRASINIWNCTGNTTINGAQIRHVMKGIHLLSWKVCNMSNVIIDDVDIRELMAQDSVEKCGIGIDMGSTDLSYANFSGPLSMSNITITNCRADPAVAWGGGATDVLTSSLWLHDAYGIDGSNIIVENNGLSPYAVLDGDDDYWMPGVGTQDCYGQITGLRVKGCEHAFIHNSAFGLRITDFEFIVAPGGGGTVPVVGLWLQNLGVGQTQLENGRIEGGIYFATSFVADTTSLRMRNIDFDGDVYTGELLLAKNTTGAGRTWGQVGTFDPTAAAGVPEIDIPAATVADRLCVWAMPRANTVANNAYGFIVVDGQAVADCAAGAIAVGDRIVAQASSAIATTTTTSPYFFARATRTKGAGAGKTTIELGFAAIADAVGTASTVLQRGTSGEAVAAWFAPAGTVSTTGLIRNPNNTTIASARLAGGSTINVLSTNASDTLQVGGAWSVTLLQGALVQVQSTSGGSGFVLDSSKFDFYQPINVDTIDEHTASAGTKLIASRFGVYNHAVATQQTVTGTRQGNAALASLLTGLAATGMIVDSSTAGGAANEQILSIYVDDTSAVTAVIERPVGMPHHAATVTSCRFENDSTITGDNTNNATFNVWRRNATGTQAAIARLQTVSGTDVTAWQSQSLGSLTNTAIAADEAVTVEITKAGTGARCRGTFTITYTLD